MRVQRSIGKGRIQALEAPSNVAGMAWNGIPAEIPSLARIRLERNRHQSVVLVPNRVQKSLVEVQYLRTTITEEQRQEFGHLVEGTIRRIESADFLPHSGIRFPQNPYSSCPYVGLCLGKQEMVDATIVRRPGADSLGWLDELNY